MLLALTLVAVITGTHPQAECKTAYGKTVCGYDCKAAFGEVKCAQTPHGICEAAYDRLVCFDPPAYVVRAFQGEPPRPSCKSGYGLITCGYQCASGYGQVQCSQTPWGVCESGYDRVLCFDPSERVIRQYGSDLPTPQCKSGYGKIACGYSCASGNGEVRCSQTPEGICVAASGAVQCFDPKTRRP
ncbi:hypothetical protein [Hyalangium versicolor]|uniref:hypothetical protein n=1 Tax=Hyalangium versicolor TaxID=2861190 RepID=UPI001CC935A4|nr:hypothetical protein [Hyalangium versicolor]